MVCLVIGRSLAFNPVIKQMDGGAQGGNPLYDVVGIRRLAGRHLKGIGLGATRLNGDGKGVSLGQGIGRVGQGGKDRVLPGRGPRLRDGG